MISASSTSRSCSNCQRKAVCRGFCDLHYRRWLKYGDADVACPPPRPRSSCSIEGCEHEYWANGYCRTHAMRVRSTGDPHKNARQVRAEKRAATPCSSPGCEGRHHRDGWCQKHWTRIQKYGDPDYVKKLAKRDSDRRVNRVGYVEVFAPDDPHAQPSTGWALEHRIVMARTIGRALLSCEQVHHVNANRQDNRPENLELWSRSQPSGARVRDLLAWARQTIATYEEIEDLIA